MKKKNRIENWCQKHLADRKLHQLLENVDQESAERAKKKGCPVCGEVLHWARFRRKVRGVFDTDESIWEWRLSFCCAREGCRKRVTPASVRFLGRRIYAGLAVVLLSAMVHGLTASRVQELREMMGVDRRTLERWRKWWLESFPSSDFWKAARARFSAPLCEQTLPLSLCRVFSVGEDEPKGLCKLLGFLKPITVAAAQIHAM